MTGTGNAAAVVIGGGPAGLAAAAALRRLGQVVVLERSADVAASWSGRYSSLRLNSTKRRSALPGLPIDRTGDRWLSGADYASYLRRYREHFGIEVRPNTTVLRLDRCRDGWLAHTANGGFGARQAVVATGWDHAPAVPSWPGLESFTGTFLHAAHYHSPRPYAGRKVLIVGSGTSAGEIAMDLVRNGAGEVLLAMRTPPTIFPRQWLGVPLAALAGLLDRLPRRAADAAGAAAQRLCNGSRRSYHLPPPAMGIATAMATRRRPPMMADGIVEALRSGRVSAVTEVVEMDGPAVLLADGRKLGVDVVIAATGYQRGLDQLVGHLDVLDHRGEPRTTDGLAARGQAGLWFVGFGAPFGGQLHLIRRQARQLERMSLATAKTLGADCEPSPSTWRHDPGGGVPDHLKARST